MIHSQYRIQKQHKGTFSSGRRISVEGIRQTKINNTQGQTHTPFQEINPKNSKNPLNINFDVSFGK